MLILLSLGLTSISAYIIKTSYEESKELNAIKKKEFDESIDIENEIVINTLLPKETKIIKFIQSTPIHYTIFLERTENYFNDSYTDNSGDDDYDFYNVYWCSNKKRYHKYNFPRYKKEYIPITQYHYNFFKSEKIPKIYPIDSGCKVSVDSSFSFTQNEITGMELIRQLIKTIPEKDMHHFDKINHSLTYIVRKYDFTNIPMYINATKINSDLITYNLYGPNKSKLIDDKYEKKTAFINTKLNSSFIICIGSFVYSIFKLTKFIKSTNLYHLINAIYMYTHY
jgi:hypothetical protein